VLRGGHVIFIWSYDRIESHALSSETIIPEATLVHLVVISGEGSVDIYINGVWDVGDDSHPGDIAIPEDRTFRIGKGWASPVSPTATYYTGELSNIAFYPRPLTEDEVLLLYNSYP
jgi:hypothetical protein